MHAAHDPREILEILLGHLGLTAEIEEEARPAGRTLHIRTSDPGRLIGRNGKVLDDLQYLLNRIITREEEAAPRIIVDVENYRQQQMDQLLEKARAAGESVRAGGPEAVLPPMNSFERRLVHNLFKDDPDLASSSPPEPGRLKSITIRRRQPAA